MPEPICGAKLSEHYLLLAEDVNFSLTRVRKWYRERRALPSLLIDIDLLLNSEKATGQLIFHYSQGKVALCEFHESAKADLDSAK